ncbi:TlpA disulfide reductase family protein [Flavobacterium pectinovorum]|uniref:TlpA disulfide reductase family protein n=1 Tax=Flavobacterium pectinovorum TaxID=29533 RepID=UPI001FAB985B|nr:TlpA disulfide reductase family protein [Flavobacterium pectinovorum]MCI9844597.1 AhpC/TSA family protein [Flavobacterium pectinovorum]
MKKIKFLGLCMCFFMALMSQAQGKKAVADSFQLDGFITGVPDGTSIRLIPGGVHTTELPITESYLKDGKFTLTGKLDGIRLCNIIFASDRGIIPIVLENAKMKLTATGVVARQDGRITFNYAQLEGSKYNEYFMKETSRVNNELSADYAAYYIEGSDEMLNEQAAAAQSKNKRVLDSIEGSERYKTFLEKQDAFFKKCATLTNDLILKNKDTFWGPLFMLTQCSYLSPDLRPIYEQFSPEAQNSYYGQKAKEELWPKSLVGVNVENFSLNDKDGKPSTVKNVIAKKKYILVDFWASWCAPCRKEIPNLKAAYQKYASKGFEIMSVSIDTDQKGWLKALGQENMPWPNLIDDAKMSKFFNVTAIPATFLMDQNGMIIAEDLRGEALEKKLEELSKS